MRNEQVITYNKINITMKITEIDEYRNFISRFNLANMFNVYDDKSLGSNYKAYNLNRGLIITGMENIPATQLSTYKVKEGDNLNLISFHLYGTIELWWIIAKLNKITDATITLQPGWVLYTLDKGTINQILNALKS